MYKTKDWQVVLCSRIWWLGINLLQGFCTRVDLFWQASDQSKEMIIFYENKNRTGMEFMQCHYSSKEIATTQIFSPITFKCVLIYLHNAPIHLETNEKVAKIKWSCLILGVQFKYLGGKGLAYNFYKFEILHFYHWEIKRKTCKEW